MKKLEEIFELFPEEDFGYLPSNEDGYMYTDAIVGVDFDSMRVIYSVKGIIENLILNGMEYEEAIEFYDFNIEGYKTSSKLPIYCYDLHIEEQFPTNDQIWQWLEANQFEYDNDTHGIGVISVADMPTILEQFYKEFLKK